MAEISGVQKLRRRTTLQQLLLFTGSSGEVAADMTTFRVSLQDGATAGGWFSQKGNVRRATSPVPGILRNAMFSDSFLYTFQNNLTIQLPSAAAFPAGQILSVMGGTGAGTNNVTVVTATSTEKIIGFSGPFGFINSTGFAINSNGIGVKLAALSTAGSWAVWN